MPRDKTYNAIPGYFERTPQELTAPGEFMEYSELVTNISRTITGLAMNVVIEDDEIRRYQEAGTVLVSPTHRSFLDITAMSLLSDMSGEGQPYFMSKRENMSNIVTAWLFSKMRTFPIENKIDKLSADSRWGIKFMQWGRFCLGDNLDKGQQDSKLIMYSEGTRKTGDVVEDLEEGSYVLSRLCKVDVLPVGIYSSYYGVMNTLRHGRPITYVAVGEPIKPKKLEEIQESMQAQYDRAKVNVEHLLAT